VLGWRQPQRARVSGSGRRDGGRGISADICEWALGTPFDGDLNGRVESPGYATSGRRWHRRIPFSFPRFDAAESPVERCHDPSRCHLKGWHVMRIRVPRLPVLMLLLLSVSACAYALRSARVADLRENPGRYQNHTVSIEGVVTNAFSIPLVPYKVYRVDDGTGEVTVLSQNDRIPTRGARVRVRGRVDDVAVLGGNAVGLHIREHSLYVKRR
jgi:hypothetical protein